MKRVELVILLLAAGTVVGSVAFITIYAGSADTQLLGISIAFALGCMATALILAGKGPLAGRPVAQSRERFAIPPTEPDEESELPEVRSEKLAGEIESAGDAFSRRKLVLGAGAVAATALGAALITPAASLGPAVGDRLRASPWRTGVRLVDENDLPIPIEEIGERAFLTAFPEGADKRELAAPVVIVRSEPDEIEPPEGREDWAPGGVMAYSKICTHAGCAVALHREPLFPPRAPGPALVCPCHYSTFDTNRGAEVIFGPAGRPLPQLPLEVDDEGYLVAGGDLSGNVGPAWLGVRES